MGSVHRSPDTSQSPNSHRWYVVVPDFLFFLREPVALNIQLPAREACSALKEIRPKRVSVAKDDRNFSRDNTLS